MNVNDSFFFLNQHAERPVAELRRFRDKAFDGSSNVSLALGKLSVCLFS